MRNALQSLSEFPRVVECLQAAETLAATLGDQRRLGWVVSNLSPVFFHLGDWSGALDAGRRALDIAQSVGDPDLLVTTRFRLGVAAYSPGDYRGAVELLESLPRGARQRRAPGDPRPDGRACRCSRVTG